MVHRSSRAQKSRGGFFSHALHKGVEFAQGMDGFVRRYGGQMRNFAMAAAPALLKAGAPALSAGVAAAGQAADSYATLRNQMDAY